MSDPRENPASGGGGGRPEQPERPCPTCGGVTPADSSAYPFCSGRCRMADLGRWFSGDYVISRRLEERDIEETE